VPDDTPSPVPPTAVIYGFHPLRETLRHRPHEVARVLVACRRGGSRRREIEALCRRHRITIEETTRAVLDRLVPGSHNGLVAELLTSSVGSHRLAGRQVPNAVTDLIVLVEDVQDPRNLGALLRVCEGAGVDRVLIRDRGSAPISPVVVRASAGAAEWLPVERVTNSRRALDELKQRGFWVYGTDPSGQAPWQVDLSGPTVLCFGGEDKGLRRLTRQACDGLLGLPMRGRVESLNLATAAAAILYETLRQRGRLPEPGERG
jgi:23S rRNA (guanosine2251-2'-O)-methyltransferase